MNFTAAATATTKPGELGYNFSAPAAPFACCPAGFTCVGFGPVWAMCMPQIVSAPGPA